MISPKSEPAESIYYDAPFTIAATMPDDSHDVDPTTLPVQGSKPAEPVSSGMPVEATAHPNESSGWLPATDRPVGGDSNILSRSATMLKRRTHSAASSLHRKGYAESMGRQSAFTNPDGRSIAGSTFINGAGTTGPNATVEADESVKQRVAMAESTLTPKQKSKVTKKEVSEGKRLSKIIKVEGKIEKRALGVALQELSDLQSLQKAAVQREAKAHAKHSKALKEYHKQEDIFLAARTKFEAAQAVLNSEADTLEVIRANARQATELMQEKSQEIDGLRQMYGVDERERAVRLVELSGTKSRWR